MNPLLVLEPGGLRVTPVSCFGHKDGVIEIDVSRVCPSLQCQAPFRFALLAPDGQILDRTGGYGDRVIFDQLDGGIYCLRIYDAGSKCSPDPIRPGEGYVINVDQPLSIKNVFESFAGNRAFYHPTGHNRADGRIFFRWDTREISTNNVLREVFYPENALPRQSFYRARLTNRNNVVIREFPRVAIGETVEFDGLPAGDYILKITTSMRRESDCEQAFEYRLLNPDPITVTYSPLPGSCTETGGLERVTVLGGLATEDVPYFFYELDRRTQNDNNFLRKVEIGTTRFYRGKEIAVYSPRQAGPPTSKPEGVPAAVGRFLTERIATSNGFVSSTQASSIVEHKVYESLLSVPASPNDVDLFDRLSGGEYILVVSEIEWNDETSEDVYFQSPRFQVINNTDLQVTVDRNRTRRPTCHTNNLGPNSNGSIAINITGGRAPYTIKWDRIPGGGIPGDQSLVEVNNLRAGVYTVTVTDAPESGCTVVQRVVLEQPQEIILELDVKDILCTETSSGQVTARATGGVRPYVSWNWTAGQVVNPINIPNNENNQISIANNLLEGQYTVTVTDGNGCGARRQFEIRQDASPIRFDEITIKPVSCFGNTDGEVFVRFSGGRVERFELQNPQGQIITFRENSPNTGELQGIPAGRYQLVAIDANVPSGRTGCFTRTEFVVPGPEKIMVAAREFTPVRCKGESNGIARFLVTGGNVGTDFPNQGIPIGTPVSQFYYWRLYQYVPRPEGPSNVAIRTGVTDRSMMRNGIGTMIEIENLPAGDYELEILQDRENIKGEGFPQVTCRSDRFRFQVQEPRAGLTVRLREVQPILCNSANNLGRGGQGYEGIIEADVRDYDFEGIPSGTPPYRYVWSRRADQSPIAPPPVQDVTTESTTNRYANLPAGEYQVVVIDANNCRVTNTTPFVLREPDFLRINEARTIVTSPIDCQDRGRVTLTWNGQSGIDFTGGTPGTNQNYRLSISPMPEDFNPNTNVNIDRDAFGRITGARITSLVPGQYTIKVRDAVGCYDTKTVNIIPPNNAINAIRTEIVQPCPNQSNGFLRVIPLSSGDGSSGDDTRVTIERRANKQTFTLPDPATTPNPFNLYNNDAKVFTNLFADVYTVRVESRRQCRFTQVIDLAKIKPVNVALEPTDVSCFDGNNGALRATITGGYGPDYTYTFDSDTLFFQNGQTISPDAADPRYRPLGSYFFSFDRAQPFDTLERMRPEWLTFQQIDRSAAFNYLENEATANPIRIFLSKDQIEFRDRTAGVIYFNLLDNRFFERDGFPVNETTFVVTEPSALQRCHITSRAEIRQPQQFVSNPLSVPYTQKLDLSCADAQNDGVIYVQPGYRQNGLTSSNITTRELNDMEPWTAENVVVRRNGEILPQDQYGIDASRGADVPTPDRGGPDFIKSGFITTIATTSAPWRTNTTPGSFRYRDRDYVISGNNLRDFIVSCPPAGLDRIDIIYAFVDAPGSGVGRMDYRAGTPSRTPLAPSASAEEIVLATIYVRSDCSRPTVTVHPIFETYRITGLSEGNYTVTFTNRRGCSITQNVTINRPAPIVATIDKMDATFCGLRNNIGGGKLMVTVTGGTAPFRYRVFRVAGNGGEDLLVEERSTPNSATASPTTFEEFMVEGGYEYYVEVVPSNRLRLIETCRSRTPNIRVNNPQAPEFEFVGRVQDVLCFGQQNGIAEVRARGGVTNPSIPNPTYTYEWRWDTGQETDFLPWGPRPTNLRSGQYTVRAVQVETACPVETTIVIGGPTAAISINARIEEPVACHDDANGVISTNIMGGTQPYSVQWAFEGNRIISPLAQPGDRVLGGLRAGRYTILVRDRNNCQQTQVVELVNPEPIFTNISDVINATCESEPNNANGSFKAKTIGGTKNYEITLQMLDPTTNQFVNSPDPLYNGFLAQDNDDVYFRNLMPGTYRIQVKDYRLIPIPNPDGSPGFVRDYQCTYISERLVIETVSRIRTAVIQTDADGNPRPNAQPNQIFLGCQSRPVYVRVIEQAGHRAQYNPLAYDWGGFGSPVVGRNDMREFNFNSEGNYTVAVIDQLGCIRLNDFSIVNRSFEVPAASFRVRNVECRGQNNGRIEGRIAGGTMPYSFTLARGGEVINSGLLPVNADMSFSLSNLSPGSYVLTLTDAEGCQLRLPAAQGQFLEIREAASIFAAGVLGETKPVSCFDASAADGAATLQFIGGQPPYNFRWFDSAAQIVREENAVFQNQFTIINMPFGTSVIEAQDANGCRQTVIVNIGRPQVNLVVTVREDRAQTTCRVNDGQLSLVIDGGRPFDDGGPLYRVTWMQGNRVIAENTTVLSELAAGTYTYRVEDANGCVRMREVVLNGPDQPRITSANVTPLRCRDGNDAAIAITVAGGLPPYTFSWSNGATTQNISNLSAGVYTGTITDAKGCTVVGGPITIENPEGFRVDQVEVRPVSACGASDGRIAYLIISPSENGPFSFSWRRLGDPTFGSINVADRDNLPAGTYEVRITDRSNCVIIDRQTVRQPSSLAVAVTKRDISCNNNNDGSINLTVTGGMMPYQYRWSNGSTEPGIANLTAGTYYGTVTDAEGCFILVEEVIVNPAPISLASATVKNVSCNGARDGEIRIEVVGGTGRYTFDWSRNGQQFSMSQNLIGISTGTYQGVIRDANGCEFISPEITITEPAQLVVDLDITDAGCATRNDGRILAEVSGGTAPYTYRWSNGDNSNMTMNLEPGIYTVTVTDANGCMAMASGEVDVVQNIQRPVLQVVAGAPNQSAISICVGSAVTIDAGVNRDYLGYLWSDGTISDPGNSAISFRRDEPGVFNIFVTVTTVCGELNSDTIQVTVVANPAKPVISFNREDSVLVATVEGNPANLRFQWQRIENNEPVNIGGATGSTLKIDRSGTYRVVASIGSCSTTSDDFDAVLVSRPSLLNARSLSLYPNPTAGSITLQGDWNSPTVTVEVLNTLGQVVLSVVETGTSQGQVNVDLSSVAAGVYQVRVRSGNSFWTGSVIKN